ncbi:unannotated protein [freshwater metagenome]|uniref:Unannotated protein n=1 Tax=freshwater metagenome TaxID=449393 RepID=A0A6J7MJ05_9ZZZZ
MGTPNLCALPTAISAPISPGDLRSVNANKSQSIMASAPADLILLMAESKFLISPVEFG